VTVRDPARLECKEVVELATEFLGDAMDPEERARLEQHLLVCPPCTIHIAQVRSAIGHLAELREREPAEVGPAFIDLFREWKARRRDDDA
jgi:hypothetical protein